MKYVSYLVLFSTIYLKSASEWSYSCYPPPYLVEQFRTEIVNFWRQLICLGRKRNKLGLATLFLKVSGSATAKVSSRCCTLVRTLALQPRHALFCRRIEQNALRIGSIVKVTGLSYDCLLHTFHCYCIESDA